MNVALAFRSLSDTSPQATEAFVEEFPMTLQVAVCAHDGWILASDMLEVQGPPNEPRTCSRTHKITVDKKAALAYAVCGDELSRQAADDVRRDAQRCRFNFDDHETTKSRLDGIIEARWEKDGCPELPWSRRAILLLGLSAQRSPLWSVSVGSAPNARAYADKYVIGDPTNSAVFFLEQYFSWNKSVRVLLPVVAHVILMGHERNRNGVDGLEIVFWENGRVTEWYDGNPALSSLKDLSQRLDDDIGQRLWNWSPNLPTPNHAKRKRSSARK